jgi:hypothetical protein
VIVQGKFTDTPQSIYQSWNFQWSDRLKKWTGIFEFLDDFKPTDRELKSTKNLQVDKTQRDQGNAGVNETQAPNKVP